MQKFLRLSLLPHLPDFVFTQKIENKDRGHRLMMRGVMDFSLLVTGRQQRFLLRRLLYYFPPNPDTDLSSYILGDKSILKDAGLENINDVEKLPAPPEIRDKVPALRFRGNISYFICTRPG
ncbi:hypothetical protein NL676_037433 [Syzygium grande]|nr:hypothetical protein NL676_037433 [Syzygium grande]